MPYNQGFRTPAQLTGVARGAFDAAYEGFGIADLLPAIENFTLDYQFVVGQSPLPAAAKFRAFNTPSMVNTVGQGQTASGKLPATSIRLHVDEYQQLKMFGQDDAIGAKFEEYAKRNAQSIAYRLVLAGAEAVETGKISVNERGLAFGVDFGRRADLTADVTIPWSSYDTATPLEDVEALKRVFKKRVAEVRLSDLSMSHLQRNAGVIKRAMRRGSDLPDMVSQEDVRTVFRDFNLGNIIVVEDTVMDTNGDEVPVFSEDAVILSSGGALGSAQIGVTAESLDSENGITSTEAPGLFAGALPTDDPQGFDVRVTGILLPVLSSANNTAVLKV